MKLTFYGAAKEVTGSCYCLEVNGIKMLIDCGLQQGQDEKEDNALPFTAGEIDYVLITHAHIDHTGRLPLLVKNGFHGQIFATSKTCELMKIMLLDSAHIQESEVEWKRRKGKRAGKDIEEPLYTTEDAALALEHFVPCEYGEIIPVHEGVTAIFSDAGHLLGSSCITVSAIENGIRKKIVFSGDIGNIDQPIIRNPEYLHEADYVVMESTYGDRYHDEAEDMVGELAAIFNKTLKRGGNVVIPSFAVGRTQELLYYIREMKEKKLVSCCEDFDVYVDSPLSMEATKIYDSDLKGYADEETVEIIENGFRPISFPNLYLCKTPEESIALNEDLRPKVIISSSGMCEAGRIRHHLKHNLWRRECSVVFVGYQAHGTLGRILLEGVDSVKLFGEIIAVNAEIYNISGMSAHADKAELLRWIGAFDQNIERIFVVHGEEAVSESFAEELISRGMKALVPDYKMEYDLLENVCVYKGIPAEYVKEQNDKYKNLSPAYARLKRVGEQMLEVIKHNEGGANKDLAKFADQLKALIEKWDR